MPLDTSYRERRLADRMQDEEFRAAYELAAQEIAQVDSVMRMIDDLRVEAGMSKAQLAREIQKNPASVRRLFTSEVNPELRTVAAMASALDAEVVIKRKRRRRPRTTSSTVAA
jgi:ribosome-binding protein aMBF1 (putative translation factor)